MQTGSDPGKGEEKNVRSLDARGLSLSLSRSRYDLASASRVVQTWMAGKAQVD